MTMTTTKTSLLLIGVLLFAFGCKRGPLAKSEPAPAPPAAPAPDATAPATNAPAETPGTNAPAAGTPTGFTVQGEPIADIPDYPNGTRTKYEIGGPKPPFARSVETKFMTNDTFENVRAFYQNAITQNGWRIVGTQQKPGEIEWTLTKGTSVAEIEIDTERTGGVSVSLERKDR
jgi:hypothetical protein